MKYNKFINIKYNKFIVMKFNKFIVMKYNNFFFMILSDSKFSTNNILMRYRQSFFIFKTLNFI